MEIFMEIFMEIRSERFCLSSLFVSESFLLRR